MAFNLTEYAAFCGVAEPEIFAERCEKLRLLLVEANKVKNLTRITEPEDFAIKHAADSLSIAAAFPELRTEKLLIADIGCGAGFPSLILALAFPNLSVCAIDSTGKKVAFVAEAAQALGLENLRTVHGRSCELNRKAEFKHRFDIVTARAVADSRILYLDARDFINRKGRFIFYKTPAQIADEFAGLELAGKTAGIHWQTTEPFSLPEDTGTRQFLYSAK